MQSDEEIVRNVRTRAGIGSAPPGPTDAQIALGVRGFVREFSYWYGRVLEEAVPQYQKLIINRINPMIRGMQLEGLPSHEAAARLVSDYAHRNFVTAGGWALEQLAISTSPRLRKSASSGIDAEWHESDAPPIANLYVIKSGTVTRNSDILAQLKQNGQTAQKRLMQSDKRALVRVHYAVLTGQRSSTFHDGVFRPSSAEFWAQALDLEHDEGAAIEMVLAMAQEAGNLLRSSGGEDSLRHMESAVEAYIASASSPNEVDWEFIARRNMGGVDTSAESKVRHGHAVDALRSAGYDMSKLSPPSGQRRAVAAKAVEVSEAPEGAITDLEVLLPEDLK